MFYYNRLSNLSLLKLEEISGSSSINKLKYCAYYDSETKMYYLGDMYKIKLYTSFENWGSTHKCINISNRYSTNSNPNILIMDSRYIIHKAKKTQWDTLLSTKLLCMFSMHTPHPLHLFLGRVIFL